MKKKLSPKQIELMAKMETYNQMSNFFFTIAKISGAWTFCYSLLMVAKHMGVVVNIACIGH